MKINTLHCCNGAEIRLSYDSPVIQPTVREEKKNIPRLNHSTITACFSLWLSLFPCLAAPLPFLILSFLFSSLSIVIYHSLAYMSAQFCPYYIFFFHRQLFTFFNCMPFVFLSSSVSFFFSHTVLPHSYSPKSLQSADSVI